MEVLLLYQKPDIAIDIDPVLNCQRHRVAMLRVDTLLGDATGLLCVKLGKRLCLGHVILSQQAWQAFTAGSAQLQGCCRQLMACSFIYSAHEIST